jgi:predicted RNA binding protein YcfA (HicA-like mRNA interferase family)
MPKKIHELKAMLRKAGFHVRPGKGSHTVWEHPDLPEESFTFAGNDGDDAQRYQVKRIEELLNALKRKRGTR